MTQIKVCSLELLPNGTMKAFYVDEIEVLATNIDGEISCIAGRCTHAGAPLAEGTIRENVLTCPWHGSQFRITDGTVLRGPAEKPLKVYKTIIREGFVFIEV